MRFRLLTLLAASTLVLGACGDPDPKVDVSDAGSAATTPAASTPAETTPASTDAEAPAAGSDVEIKAGECADVPQPAAKSPDTPEPTGELDAAKRNLITLKTSCGEIKIELDAKDNPKTANSLATLAKAGYFDNGSFHRVVKDFVIQGGDPAGNGTSGPSWKVVEAPPADTKYTEGVVAMAKTEAEAPGTSGSQFFIVTAPEVQLPADYAVAGKVVKGQDIANLIAEQESSPGSQQPGKPIAIFSATFEAR